MTEKQARHKIKKNVWSTKVLLVLLAALMIVYGVNIYVTFGLNSYLFEKAETAAPAKVQLIEIIDGTCSKCFNIVNLADALRQVPLLKITDENSYNDYRSAKAQELIKKYSIQRLPAMIITGDTDKTADLSNVWKQLNGRSVGKDVVVESYPPYVNTKTNNVEGLVSMITITADKCDGCYDASIHRNIIKDSFQIFLDNEYTYGSGSDQAKDFISRYSITSLPTIVLSSDVSVYPGFADVWQQVGSTESDGWYVFRNTDFMLQQGGYFDLNENEFVQNTQV